MQIKPKTINQIFLCMYGFRNKRNKKRQRKTRKPNPSQNNTHLLVEVDRVELGPFELCCFEPDRFWCDVPKKGVVVSVLWGTNRVIQLAFKLTYDKDWQCQSESVCTQPTLIFTKTYPCGRINPVLVEEIGLAAWLHCNKTSSGTSISTRGLPRLEIDVFLSSLLWSRDNPSSVSTNTRTSFCGSAPSWLSTNNHFGSGGEQTESMICFRVHWIAPPPLRKSVAWMSWPAHER